MPLGEIARLSLARIDAARRHFVQQGLPDMSAGTIHGVTSARS
jgi:hypothetical protein